MAEYDDLAHRLQNHVVSRGGQSRDEDGNIVIENGAWAMMLQAANAIHDLESRVALTAPQIDFLRTIMDQALEDEDPDGEFAQMAQSIIDALPQGS